MEMTKHLLSLNKCLELVNRGLKNIPCQCDGVMNAKFRYQCDANPDCEQMFVLSINRSHLLEIYFFT
ncbi:hypothetical protein HanIR_Chr14g0699431 [Helianthus annuus]|nr:hypothetical protein HanIR_Chr14g0699431 [Helianthus annuus]